MEIIKIENLNFTYPYKTEKTIDNISFSVNQGEFILLCGKSGCGKTTLLRLLKPSLSPFGETDGAVYFNGKLLADTDIKKQASSIGFVMQNPDNQIACDKVWHELAFGLESLGCKTPEIRARVSEMASFFGIQNWFYKNTNELSGGQKQLLSLASVMVMQPSVLILDEPTSQLDPIAASEFLEALEKINRELGTTIILTEHRLEDAFPVADRILVMDEGRIIADEAPRNVCKILKELNHPMCKALPAPVKVYGELDKNSAPCPLTVRDGRIWLEEYSNTHTLNSEVIPSDNHIIGAPVIEMSDVWFRYEKSSPDVVKGMSLSVSKGELFCLLGGNGTGKTTALSLISGLNTPYRGKITIKGQNLSKIKDLYNGLLGVLPQNPQSVFVKKTVYLDLLDMCSDEEQIKEIALLCRIENLLNCHPYDLSGGEQQRTALAKILLMNPEILLLDEPTKGMDAHFKEEFAFILEGLKAEGVTIVMVSHDIEFCAKYADRCALVFDGNITSQDTPRNFFKGKNFYTTSANRMARNVLPDAVLAEDIILAFGGIVKKERPEKRPPTDFPKTEIKKEDTPPLTNKRMFAGIVFSLMFVLTSLAYMNIIPDFQISLRILRILAIVEIAFAFLCLFPQKEMGTKIAQISKSDKKLTKRTLVSAFLILLLIPLTLYIGIFFLGDRKYYFTSLLIIFETMIPFCMIFESRKPQARELVVISVLCALAVAGRSAFFMLPQFKPVVALVIISGVCFGGETGFLVGAVSGFVSNFLFGHGPWTPWQMFSLGIIGFVGGILFTKGFLRKTRTSLCIFGFLSALIIYGLIMNPASVIMWQENINIKMILSACIAGIPFDLVHSLSTAFFLWFISEPMIEKLERIKIKYGLIECVTVFEKNKSEKQ